MAFEGMSPALGELETRFPIRRAAIAQAGERTGEPEAGAKSNFVAGIFGEALVSAGEDRAEVYATLFPTNGCLSDA